MKQESKYNAIIPLSGGIDSCAVAYYWLKDHPNERALLLHIHLVNGESKDRCKLEHKACKEIISYYNQEGLNNFDYKEARLDYQSAGEIPPVWDIEAVNFLVGTYMRGNKIATYIKATNKDDFAQEDFQDRLDNSMRILENVVYPDLENIKVLYPQNEMTKQEIMASLPNTLVQRCWYCRTPKAGLPCGVCDACISIH